MKIYTVNRYASSKTSDAICFSSLEKCIDYAIILSIDPNIHNWAIKINEIDIKKFNNINELIIESIKGLGSFSIYEFDVDSKNKPNQIRKNTLFKKSNFSNIITPERKELFCRRFFSKIFYDRKT
jgi:hypothetical protein